MFAAIQDTHICLFYCLKDDKGSASADKIDHDALSIYIGNVDYSATEEELRNTFISCGEIVRVTIIKNMKTGHPKGAAFIEFKDKDGVQSAMGLNGKEVKGRPLIVTSKKPRPENKPRGDRQNFDRRQQRSGPPPYGAGPGGPYGGGGRSQYPPNRGGYHYGGGGGGGGGFGGQRGGQPPVPMDPAMQRMPQTRYDPYRRPDMYDPYMMRGNAPPPAPVYYGGGGGGGGHHGGNYQDKMGSGGQHHGGGGGGGGSRGPQQNQRYSSHQFNRR